MKAHATGVALAGFVSVIWASSFFFIKQGIARTDPLTFAGYRYLLGGAILAVVVVARGGGLRGSPRAWGYAAACGIAAYLVGQGLLYVAQALVSPLAGAFFYSLAPAFVLVLGSIALRRAPTAAQLAGLGVIVLGTLSFVHPASVAAIPAPALIEFTISNVATAAYLLLMRRALDEGIPGQWLSATSLLLGGAALLGVVLLTGRSPVVAQASLGSLVWLAAVNTALAYAAYARALALVQPFEVSVMNASIPLFAAAIAWAVVREPIDARQLVGVLVAAAGIVLVQVAALVRLRPSQAP